MPGLCRSRKLRSAQVVCHGLSRESFVRPGKLFTARESILVRHAGVLTPAAHWSIVDAVIRLLLSLIALFDGVPTFC
jgi:hypothetical protein